VSWDRSLVGPALAQVLTDAVVAAGETITVFEKPPGTLNPPAFVVARPTTVRYATFAFGVDDVELPVLCVGPLDGDDRVAELIAFARAAISEPTLGGVVQICYPTGERNWRAVNIAGTDLLSAELVFSIQM
jgi:hypothetical protein